MTINCLNELPPDVENFLAESQLSYSCRKACLHAVKEAPGTYFQAVDAKGRTSGLIKIMPLEWDTEVLGIPCQRLLVMGEPPENGAELLRHAIEHTLSLGTHLIDAKVKSSEPAWLTLLQHEGFELRDTLVSFELPLDTPSPFDDSPEWKEDFEIRRAKKEDAQSLYALGAASFKDPEATPSRILTDSDIPPDRATHFYGEWAANLVRGQSLVTFVATKNGRLIGFLGLAEDQKEKRLRIPLNAVHPNARNKGVYQALLCHALVFGNGQGYKAITINAHLAQGTVAHIWSKLNAEMGDSLYCLHYWAPKK